MLRLPVQRRSWESLTSVGCILFLTPIISMRALPPHGTLVRVASKWVSVSTQIILHQSYIHFTQRWPSTETLEDLADTPYFRSLFSRHFDTFILNAFRPGRSASYWRQEFTSEDERSEEECFASLTRYLLSTYKHSNKTFIIQNWEGDWALRGTFDPNTEPEPTATAAMIRWVSARQRGVERGRAESKSSDAKVFHGLEVNLVKQTMTHGKPSVTTRCAASCLGRFGILFRLGYKGFAREF